MEIKANLYEEQEHKIRELEAENRRLRAHLELIIGSLRTLQKTLWEALKK